MVSMGENSIKECITEISLTGELTQRKRRRKRSG